MNTKQRNSQCRALRASLLIPLTVIILFSCSHKTLAQQWSTSGNDIYNSNSGNVGVGTSSPQSSLDVSGLTGLTLRTGAGSAGFSIFDRSSVPGDQLFFQGNAGNYSVFNVGTKNASFSAPKLSAVALWTVDNAVSGNATQFQIQHSPTYGGVLFTQKFGTGAQGDKRISLQSTWNQGSVPAQLVLETNGNVGIGIPTPGYRLDVQGGSINSSGGLCIAGDCKTAWSQVSGSQWTTSGTSINYTNGNVGIGTTSPGNYKLNVNGSLFGAAMYTSYVADGLYGATAVPSRINTYNFNGGILFGYEDLGLGDYSPRIGLQQTYDTAISPNITTTKASIGLVRNGNITIKGGASNGEFVRIDNSGNVGIGTATPGAKLEVVGNVNVSGTGNITAAGTIEGGNIKAKYQDVAEWVESSQELPAGTVVVVDHTKSNQVITSSQSYDTRVAGVVSVQPGIALGEQTENKVLVATTGRVRIKVDATSNPIQVGDLLVTSDIPGVAMKSQPLNVGGVQIHRPGTIVGKALEPLEKSSGQILVLLSLQ